MTAVESEQYNTADETSVLRYAFQELLAVRNFLASKMDQTKDIRSIHRRMRKAHAAVQKQLQGIIADLHAQQVSIADILAIMDEAEQFDSKTIL